MIKFLKRTLLLFLLLGILAACGYYYYSLQQADALQKQNSLESLIAQTESQPDFTPYDQLDPFFLEATVAVEDARFYTHNGIDLIGLGRALASQFGSEIARSGGSTITQQVVKNLYGKYNAGLSWKGTEMILALKLEKILTKTEILALYVNIINYGDSYTGIRQASEGYFGVLPGQLSEAQASLLAGIPQSPATYQLSTGSQAAKKKQAVVLNAMVRNEMLTQSQADAIYAEPVYYMSQGYWNAVLSAAAKMNDLQELLLAEALFFINRHSKINNLYTGTEI